MKSNLNNTIYIRSQRQGTTIIVVIAFYAVAVTLFAVWIRTTLSHQRQARFWHEKVQATWLADAGMRRAAARLTIDPDYSGEHWQIEADQLGSNQAAAVEIRIEKIESPSETIKLVDGTANRVRIVTIAELPVGNNRHVRRTKSTEISLSRPN